MKKKYLNPPQILIGIYLIILLAAAFFIEMDLVAILNDSLIKWAMNGVIVLSLIPMINVGAGRNFGMSIGLSAGLLGMIYAVNARHTSFFGILTSIAVSIPIAVVFGFFYSKILNRLKGNEEIVGSFAGFSFIPLMNIFYTFVNVENRQMLYPMGGFGLRPKINLDTYFALILDNWMTVKIGKLSIPTGLLLIFFSIAFLIYAFGKTKTGESFSIIAENEQFAHLSGLEVNSYRTLGIILSMVIGAIGVIIYTQSYGILHLYDGPFMMSFPAISAIVIGGASPKKATVSNALVGTFLYQTTYLLSIPVANALLLPELSEILRTIITNAIILYAFIFERRSVKNEASKA